MVELYTPRVVPASRGAGQVSNARSQALTNAGQVMQNVANDFSAFYEKEAAINADLLLATARADWARDYAERAKSAGAGFTKNIMSDYDAYVAKAMEGAPKRKHSEVKAGFAKMRLRIETQALAREAAARAAAKAKVVAEARRLKGVALVHETTRANLAELIEGANAADTKYLTGVYIEAQIMDDPAQALSELNSGDFDSQLTAGTLMGHISAAEREAKTAKDKITAIDDEARNERANVLLSHPELLPDLIAIDPENEDFYSRWAVTGRVESDPVSVLAELKAGDWDGNLTTAQKSSLMKSAESAIESNARTIREEARRANTEQNEIDKDEAALLLKQQQSYFYKLTLMAGSEEGLTPTTITAAVDSEKITPTMGRTLLNSVLDDAATETNLDVYNQIIDMQDRGEDTADILLF